MVVASGVVDFVDSVNHVDHILDRNGLVRAKHHGGLAVVADFGVDEVGELGLIGGRFVHEILELLVHVDGNGLLGHGLAVA